MMNDVTEQEKPAKLPGRGFASMTPERRREIAALGGRSAHAQGTAHKWTKEEAAEAGKKGGMRTSEVYAQRIRERLGELSDE